VKGPGRPSAYKPEFAAQARKLCELGATDFEIAKFFEIHISSLYRWKATYSEFSDALKAGKQAADDRVEHSLFHRAVGYTFESEKVFQFQGQIVRAATTEHVPPDATAAIFWLKNRKPAEWRDRSEVVVEKAEISEQPVSADEWIAKHTGATAH
jgi:hypothetical protein